jgi:hypothetical protein
MQGKGGDLPRSARSKTLLCLATVARHPTAGSGPRPAGRVCKHFIDDTVIACLLPHGSSPSIMNPPRASACGADAVQLAKRYGKHVIGARDRRLLRLKDCY